MAKPRRSRAPLVLIALLVIAALLWFTKDLWHEGAPQKEAATSAGNAAPPAPQPVPGGAPGVSSPPGVAGAPGVPGAAPAPAPGTQAAGPTAFPGAPASAPGGVPGATPGPVAGPMPAPPGALPQLPPESSQAERQKAFGLKESIDRIVRRDEPFDVAGKSLTVKGILEKAGEREPPQVLPSIQERDITPGTLRRPVVTRTGPGPIYYGIRIVRPGENVWSIHYHILREYFAHRSILLPPGADAPLRTGLSSPLARILKFLEGVVRVYDVDSGRLVTDINLIQPRTLIVFFKISDLFIALNQVGKDDLDWLHYAADSLRIAGPKKTADLIDRKTLRE